MSRVIGSELPEALFSRLTAPAGDRPFLAVVVITSDSAGWPHPALLSYGEVVALEPTRLRFAIGAASQTADNLRRSGRVTFCFVEPGMVYYIKARLASEQRIRDFPGLARFEAAVEAALIDEPPPDEAGSAVLDGIRFTLPERRREQWDRLIDRLRDAT